MQCGHGLAPEPNILQTSFQMTRQSLTSQVRTRKHRPMSSICLFLATFISNHCGPQWASVVLTVGLLRYQSARFRATISDSRNSSRCSRTDTNSRYFSSMRQTFDRMCICAQSLSPSHACSSGHPIRVVTNNSAAFRYAPFEVPAFPGRLRRSTARASSQSTRGLHDDRPCHRTPLPHA